MRKHVYPSHLDMVITLLDHYEQASSEARAGGAGWYTMAQREAMKLSRDTGVTLHRAAAIIAVLSPQLQWGVNLRIARQVCEYGEALEGVLRANEDKARRIMAGERPLAVLGGPKVRAFYRAMLGDENAAVLDTWMWYALGWPEGGAKSGRRYEEAANALREAARRVELSVPQFQAIIWWHVRGVKPLDERGAA